MGKANPSTGETRNDLAHFEAENSQDGRLLHYAKGRIRTFLLRQTLTAFGSLTIGVLTSAWLGFVLAILALAGEAMDFLALRRVISQLERGQRGNARQIALVGAAVQGASIAACVVLCWRFVPVSEAHYFASSFLIAAGINAGLGRPHFKAGADVRLMIFIATGAVMLALDLRQESFRASAGYGYFAASFILLVYISGLFIRLLERNYEQRRRHEYALLKHQEAQEQARLRLAESARISQRLALVAKYASDSILISDPDGRIEWVNDAFTRITGYEFDEAVGRMPSDILNAPGTDPDTLKRLQTAREARAPVRAEILNKSKSGKLLWMEISVMPILDDAGLLKHWIAVERDISQAKDREAELARARVEAEEAGRAKSRFLANMSHEIRTPMNGIIGVAELISQTRLSKVQADYVATITESGHALMTIINDILDLAKLQSGKATLDIAAFSPKACIESVLRILGPQAAKKGLSLEFDALSPDGFVLGDEGKLRQILMNLVGNAVKFTRQGGVRVTLHLPDQADDPMRIDVADTGIGIAETRLGAIFESFSQADNGIGRHFGGTGLGLTISSMQAEQMGGDISVRSEVGKGSVFTLRARLPRTETVVAVAERRALPRVRPGLTVLIAEDNRTNMMIVRKMLQDSVSKLVEAINGTEAVSHFMAAAPDLILMDVSMPEMDGLQATREIRAYETARDLPSCPILALTANAFGEDREACHAAGMDGFLVKPLSKADLLAAIAAHCPERSDGPRQARVIGL